MAILGAENKMVKLKGAGMEKKCTMKLGDKEIKGIGSWCLGDELFTDEFTETVVFTGKFDPPDPYVNLKKGDIVDMKDENGQFFGKAECIEKDENGATFRMVDK